ncbi:MAG: hypothetical protein ABIR60_08650 [Allosphingosinicella sp.]
MARQLDQGAAELVADAELGDLVGNRGGRRRALHNIGRAHRSGALGGLGDIDMSSFVVSQATIDAEAAAFDGRLNAWLLDFAGAAAALPKSFVQQVDDFVGRWRAQKDAFWFQTNRLTDLMNAESEFNRLKTQAAQLGAASSVGNATAIANGKRVDADKIPPGSSWFDRVETLVKVGGVIVGGVALIKVSSDLGVWKKLGRLVEGKAHS